MVSKQPVDGKPVVLVTGASTGIGAAAVRRFAGAGFEAVATMRRPVDAALRLDVTDRGSIDEAVSEVLRRFGRIDVLVNNAGYGLMGPLEAIGPAALERQFATNVLGLASVTQAVLPTMREARRGVIVNISSIVGRMTFPYMSAYTSTKFAVEGLSESLRYELKPFGIRVKLVEPGGIRTDFGTRSLEVAMSPPYEARASRWFEQYRKRVDSLPGPEKVADAIFKAATDGTDRLRYPAHSAALLAFRRGVPDALWRRMMEWAAGR